MKNIFLLFFAILFSANLSAQNLVEKDIAKVQKAQATYSLDEEQTIQYKKIVARYTKNLAEIQALEAGNPDLYQQKMMSLIQGNETSIKRLLNAAQLKVYQAEKLEKRKARAAYVTQLKDQGKTKEEMKKALIEWQIAQ